MTKDVIARILRVLAWISLVLGTLSSVWLIMATQGTVTQNLSGSAVLENIGDGLNMLAMGASCVLFCTAVFVSTLVFSIARSLSAQGERNGRGTGQRL
jgi:ABC-type antimicrobial peptide transport system permease subunit